MLKEVEILLNEYRKSIRPLQSQRDSVPKKQLVFTRPNNKVIPAPDNSKKDNALYVKCVDDNAISCSELGEIYYEKEDFGRALAYLIHACNIGSPSSCVTVASLYRDGEGAKINPEKTASYFLFASRIR